eukprot:3684-Hanusia_phi.AAC.3
MKEEQVSCLQAAFYSLSLDEQRRDFDNAGFDLDADQVIVHGLGGEGAVLDVLKDIVNTVIEASGDDNPHDSSANAHTRKLEVEEEFEGFLERLERGQAQVKLRKVFLYSKSSCNVAQEIWIADKSNPQVLNASSPHKAYVVVHVHHHSSASSLQECGPANLGKVDAIEVANLGASGANFPLFRTCFEIWGGQTLKAFPWEGGWQCDECHQYNGQFRAVCGGRENIRCEGVRPCCNWDWRNEPSLSAGAAKILQFADSSLNWPSESMESLHRGHGGLEMVREYKLGDLMESFRAKFRVLVKPQPETIPLWNEPLWTTLPEPEVPVPPYRILFVGANNSNTPELSLKEEKERVRVYFERMFGQSYWENYLKTEGSVLTEPSDLASSLQSFNPHILHFACHGQRDALQLYRADIDLYRLANAIEAHFDGGRARLQLIVLNACESCCIAEQLSKHVDFVISHMTKVEDSDALNFSREFYMALGQGKSLRSSFHLGRLASSPSPYVMYGRKDACKFRMDLQSASHNVLPQAATVTSSSTLSKESGCSRELYGCEREPYLAGLDSAAAKCDQASPPLKTVSNIIPSDPDAFVDRISISSQIQGWFVTNRKVLVIHGLGGCGKTTIVQHFAREVVRKQLRKYVWYFDAFRDTEDDALSGIGGLNTDWTDLVIELDPSCACQPQVLGNAKSEALKQLRMQSGSWLFIFDNVPDLDVVRWLVQDFPWDYGKTIIISRSQGWTQGFKNVVPSAIHVEGLEETEACQLVYERFERFRQYPSETTLFVTTLCCFPLVIVHALAYCRQPQNRIFSPKDYLKQLDEKGKFNLLIDHNMALHSRFPEVVNLQIQTIMSNYTEHFETALRALKIICLLGEPKFPIQLLEPELNIFWILETQSFVQADNKEGWFRIHPLVLETIRQFFLGNDISSILLIASERLLESLSKLPRKTYGKMRSFQMYQPFLENILSEIFKGFCPAKGDEKFDYFKEVVLRMVRQVDISWNIDNFLTPLTMWIAEAECLARTDKRPLTVRRKHVENAIRNKVAELEKHRTLDRIRKESLLYGLKANFGDNIWQEYEVIQKLDEQSPITFRETQVASKCKCDVQVIFEDDSANDDGDDDSEWSDIDSWTTDDNDFWMAAAKS